MYILLMYAEPLLWHSAEGLLWVVYRILASPSCKASNSVHCIQTQLRATPRSFNESQTKEFHHPTGGVVLETENEFFKIECSHWHRCQRALEHCRNWQRGRLVMQRQDHHTVCESQWVWMSQAQIKVWQRLYIFLLLHEFDWGKGILMQSNFKWLHWHQSFTVAV